MFSLYLSLCFYNGESPSRLFPLLGTIQFTSQQPKWWLYIMKTLNFISHGKCKQKKNTTKKRVKKTLSIGKTTFIYLCSASCTWNFESAEREFVGRWCSIYTGMKIRTWKIDDWLFCVEMQSHPPEDCRSKKWCCDNSE